ncbi:MAG: hypothetical protein EXR72_26220 [Myxococcales bacterium]|nr:hypothetical protein [Myxococcales bacterium]
MSTFKARPALAPASSPGVAEAQGVPTSALSGVSAQRSAAAQQIQRKLDYWRGGEANAAGGADGKAAGGDGDAPSEGEGAHPDGEAKAAAAPGGEGKPAAGEASKESSAAPTVPAPVVTAVSIPVFPSLCRPGVAAAPGKAGEAAVKAIACEHKQATLHEGPRNRFGEKTGVQSSDVKPALFFNGGKVGQGPVYWGGGNGGQGQQNVGSIDLVAPEYDGAEPADKDKPARAWIRAATGTASVTRSYMGVTPGAAGATGGFYFTAKASVRTDRHEELHVSSSKMLHDAYIKLLEARIAKHTGEANALAHGKSKAEAIDALKSFLDWNAAVTAFQTKDAAANQGGGSTDSVDMASADFVQNRGPKKIGGVNYANLIAMPGEADPA